MKDYSDGVPEDIEDMLYNYQPNSPHTMNAEDSIKPTGITRSQVVEMALMEALTSDDLALTEEYANRLLQEHLDNKLQALKEEVNKLEKFSISKNYEYYTAVRLDKIKNLINNLQDNG